MIQEWGYLTCQVFKESETLEMWIFRTMGRFLGRKNKNSINQLKVKIGNDFKKKHKN